MVDEMSVTDGLYELEEQIPQAMQADRFRLRKQLRSIRRARRQGKPTDKSLRRLQGQLQRSCELREMRRGRRPAVTFEMDLPINTKRQEIAEAIERSQVVIVCGETGSGKSTQLPKICLDVGRGIDGFIGHTQPRRIAARSVAARLAEELGSSVGEDVGFKIRFADTIKPHSHVKLMTDGMLLAETQQDPFLDHYDTLIVDEAHERSLNIDFLLGYVKRLLPKRPDLRLIITSATIDAERFAAHFPVEGGPAPVIEVSGRAYPVETRYQPATEDEAGKEEDDRDRILKALDQLTREGPGDVLIFLPTERDIRDLAKSLRGWAMKRDRSTEVVPLYARLPTAQQQRIFQPGKHRRIVLATNVAESSLTVPGIRYVIDTGTARISRYSPRWKVQRLPIEPISQASADQRQGRCGRIASGICVRLYGEEDYLARDRYTTPEIRRTNLAGVILQMLSLRLGAVDEFPFLEPPRADAIRDGYKTLFELGAIDGHRRLTEMGRSMSRLPVDPRIARMILAGDEENCLNEVLIVAAALEVQDPRERPPEKEKQADAAHVRFLDEQSDFMSFLRLWDFFHHLKEDLSRSQLRKACQQNFLSLNRLREWQDVHRQLVQLVRENGFTLRPRRDQYEPIHRALLTGLLANVAMLTERHEYQAAGGAKSYLWPGSGVFAKKPKWVIAAEVIETRKRYLRNVGRIAPEWIEPLAGHLVKRSYSDPYWSRKRSTVLATEKVTLFGLSVVAGRPVRFGPIDPEKARQLFIERALVDGDFNSNAGFFQHNRKLVEELQTLGAKSRRSEYLVPDATLYAFYEERLPQEVYDAATLRRWLKEAPSSQVAALQMTRDDLIPDPGPAGPEAFPDQIEAGPLALDLAYRFQPGDEADGLSVTIPREAFRQLDHQRLEWLVPGLLEEKVLALIRCLPKSLRRNFVPAADSAKRAVERIRFGQGPLLPAVAATLSELAEERIPVEAFQLERLPHHLRVNVRVVDDAGQLVAQGRDLEALREEMGVEQSVAAGQVEDSRWQREGLTQWDFGELPESVELERGDLSLQAYPALVDQGDSASLTLMDHPEAARRATHSGLRRLFYLAEQRELKSQVHWLPRLDEIKLYASTLRHKTDLRTQLMELLADRAIARTGDIPRDAEAFAATCKAGRQELLVAVQDVAKLIGQLFEAYHQVRLQLDQAKAPQWCDAVQDMREQLDDLMAEGFLAATPWQWLKQYPRYLQAMLSRLEKLQAGGLQRDLQGMSQLMPLLGAYQQRRRQHREQGLVDPELEYYGWMLEEFRVSLFAQQLGTSIKVSPQRLEKQWAKVLGQPARPLT